MNRVQLKKDRELSLKRGHPWVFSGAIGTADFSLPAGETVEVFGSSGQWLARGAWNPNSDMRIRVWTFESRENIHEEYFRLRLLNATKKRGEYLAKKEEAFRLVHGESDGLPGCIVDRYGEYLVCQFNSSGAERYRWEIWKNLKQLFQPSGILERSDLLARKKEGLPQREEMKENIPEKIEFKEGAIAFSLNLMEGQKTGFYLDQAENRRIFSQFCGDKEVLDCFCYTGAFSLWADKGGAANITGIDSSQFALDTARFNFMKNGMAEDRVELIRADVFKELRRFRDQNRNWDSIVLDPPKFAESKNQVELASRAYKDINLLALKMLREGGRLFTFSCSGHLSRELFQKIVSSAALDSGRQVVIEKFLGQPADHPVTSFFPEGEYLKGLICRVW